MEIKIKFFGNSLRQKRQFGGACSPASLDPGGACSPASLDPGGTCSPASLVSFPLSFQDMPHKLRIAPFKPRLRQGKGVDIGEHERG